MTLFSSLSFQPIARPEAGTSAKRTRCHCFSLRCCRRTTNITSCLCDSSILCTCRATDSPFAFFWCDEKETKERKCYYLLLERFARRYHFSQKAFILVLTRSRDSSRMRFSTHIRRRQETSTIDLYAEAGVGSTEITRAFEAFCTSRMITPWKGGKK